MSADRGASGTRPSPPERSRPEHLSLGRAVVGATGARSRRRSDRSRVVGRLAAEWRWSGAGWISQLRPCRRRKGGRGGSPEFSVRA